MINLAFLFLFIAPVAQASLDSVAAQKTHQALGKQQKQAPKPKITSGTLSLSPEDLKLALQAKKLLTARGWENAAKDVIEVFDKYLNRNVTSIILDYCSDPNNEFDQQLPEIWRGPKMHSDHYYPILELRFAEDRTYVEAIFDYYTHEEYLAAQQKDPHYKGEGSKKYWISTQKEPKAFAQGDPEEGIVSDTNFFHTMADEGHFNLRRSNPHFCNDGYKEYRIQDRAVGVTDDGLLKAQFETSEHQHHKPSKELLEAHPGKIFVEQGFFTAQFINISLHVNMAKLLKAILLTPNFLNEEEPSSCVIL